MIAPKPTWIPAGATLDARNIYAELAWEVSPALYRVTYNGQLLFRSVLRSALDRYAQHHKLTVTYWGTV